jgi:hypothetical protein
MIEAKHICGLETHQKTSSQRVQLIPLDPNMLESGRNVIYLKKSLKPKEILSDFPVVSSTVGK